jgi:hypothetical protein
MFAIIITAVVIVVSVACWLWCPVNAQDILRRVTRHHTVTSRLEEFGARAEQRWKPWFENAGLDFPPRESAWLAFKDEMRIDVYARGRDDRWHWIRSCRILAASGTGGPKLREGDRQVPEGAYPIELLNPNSLYHVSMRVGYPNAFDREQARREGRIQLGGDIMIHGKAVSAGCLAMGDEAAEDLFTLAARMELQHIEVLICPQDFRTKPQPRSTEKRDWVLNLYEELKVRLSEFPVPPPP